MNKSVLIIGATSAIASATAHAFAAQGYDCYLAGRDNDELQRIAADIAIRYSVEARYGLFDAERVEAYGEFVEQVWAAFPQLSGVVYAAGFLAEQEQVSQSPPLTQTTLVVNFTAAVAVLEQLALRFEARRSGFIIGISSVAGDRGRQSNYTYGAAKGGFSLYLQGLRNRLFASGVRVVTIKPGFVDTAMTYGMPGLFLVASPADIGARIANAAHKGKEVRYLPGFWRWIMLIIIHIPEAIFKRLKL